MVNTIGLFLVLLLGISSVYLLFVFGIILAVWVVMKFMIFKEGEQGGR